MPRPSRSPTLPVVIIFSNEFMSSRGVVKFIKSCSFSRVMLRTKMIGLNYLQAFIPRLYMHSIVSVMLRRKSNKYPPCRLLRCMTIDGRDINSDQDDIKLFTTLELLIEEI